MARFTNHALAGICVATLLCAFLVPASSVPAELDVPTAAATYGGCVTSMAGACEGGEGCDPGTFFYCAGSPGGSCECIPIIGYQCEMPCTLSPILMLGVCP